MHHRNTLNISRIRLRNLGLNQDLHESHLGNIWYLCGIHMGSIWDPHGKYMGSTWETCVMYLRKTWVPYWIPDKSHMGPIFIPYVDPTWVSHMGPIEFQADVTLSCNAPVGHFGSHGGIQSHSPTQISESWRCRSAVQLLAVHTPLPPLEYHV